jgi:hypothetical protein
LGESRWHQLIVNLAGGLQRLGQGYTAASLAATNPRLSQLIRSSNNACRPCWRRRQPKSASCSRRPVRPGRTLAWQTYRRAMEAQSPTQSIGYSNIIHIAVYVSRIDVVAKEPLKNPLKSIQIQD